MKKIFFAVLAVAELVSCSKEQIVNVDKGEAISFESAFVENATRATDLTTANLQDFGVYGTVAKGGNTALIFNNTKVYKGVDGFKYDVPQYWIAAAQYYFTAIAPYTNAKWSYATTTAHTGTISFNNAAAEANQDLLFAYVKPDQTPAQINTTPDKVGFTFNHMLSRVRFTFANGFGEGSNITLQVYGVTITDAYATADLVVTNGTPADDWSNFNGTLEKNFGKVGGATLATLTDTGDTKSAATEHFYLIPANKTYNVTFNIDLYQAGVKLDTYTRTATIPAVGMQKGKSYDITTTLTAQNTSDDGKLYPIEFKVDEVKTWDPATGGTNVDATVNQPANN